MGVGWGRMGLNGSGWGRMGLDGVRWGWMVLIVSMPPFLLSTLIGNN